MRHQVRTRVRHRTHDFRHLVLRDLMVLDTLVIDKQLAADQIANEAGESDSRAHIDEHVHRDLELANAIELCVTREVVKTISAGKCSDHENPGRILLSRHLIPLAEEVSIRVALHIKARLHLRNLHEVVASSVVPACV